ncbi:MAG: trypsin-like peptidase domain-containing protein [Defluviitaleaceae bacterium]|nr:trypsin-like peptidase domain-containing protein [Defluviitaleaceae bacterium]
MNEDKKLHDIFGLSEIPQIQEEIEREIEKDLTSENFERFLLVPQNVEELMPPSPPLAEAPSFYRETIKPAQKKSWFKTAMALFFICTLGTGTLGFGIGSGWAFFRDGTEATSSSYNFAPESLSFTNISYVFEQTTEHPSVSSVSDMVELISPSVVGITTFRDRDDPRFAFNSSSYGSGIIFSDSYDRIFIATNRYIVRGGYRWEVSIDGSAPISARPAGHNRYYDLAILYITKAQLLDAGIDAVAFATFGDSDLLRIGDDVLALGNAMGEGTSVTRGIISAKERKMIIPYRLQEPNDDDDDGDNPLLLLQTDAAINYGNSGGPLVNTRGEIIGITINQATNQIIGSSSVEGMGYSIPSNTAMPILMEIIADYRTPAIGISGFSLSEDMHNRAESWGIPELGVLVSSVQEGRPAYLAGIRANDVITSFDGQPIFDMPQLQAAVRQKNIGDTVEMRILRNGTLALTVYVELAMMIRDTF